MNSPRAPVFLCLIEKDVLHSKTAFYDVNTEVLYLRGKSWGRSPFPFTKNTIIFFLYWKYFFGFGVEKNSTPRRKDLFESIISQWNCWIQSIRKQNKDYQKSLWKIKLPSSNQLISYAFSDGKFIPIQTEMTKSQISDDNNNNMLFYYFASINSSAVK